jgi:hydrogenase expression/formation protein HypC
MCLSIPTKIESIEGSEAKVSFSGSTLRVSLKLVENAKIGDYVLVHAGYAIQLIDVDEAQKTLELLKKLES